MAVVVVVMIITFGYDVEKLSFVQNNFKYFDT